MAKERKPKNSDNQGPKIGKKDKSSRAPLPFKKGDVLVSKDEEWGDLMQVHVMGSDGKGGLHGLRSRYPGENAKAVTLKGSIDPDGYFVRPKMHTEQYGLLEQVRGVASNIVMSLSKEPEVEALLAEVLKKFDAAMADLVTNLFRCLVASGELTAEKVGKRNPKVVVSLADHAKAAERSRAYAASFAAEISYQSQRIGHLIRHSQTVGNFRESLVRTLLQKYVPQRYHVATGFIFPSDRQQDIIIYDQIEHSPLFREGDLVVVPRGAVRAVIEVKTNLENADLGEALEILTVGVPRGDADAPPIFKGIFGFGREALESIGECLRKFHAEPDKDATLDKVISAHGIYDIHDTVTAICVLEQSLHRVVFLPREIGGKDIVTPAAIEVGSVAGRASQGALFFDSLCRHLRHPFEGSQEMELIGSLLNGDASALGRTWFYDDVWGPYRFPDDDLHAEAAAKLNDMAAACNLWLLGLPWELDPPSGESP